VLAQKLKHFFLTFFFHEKKEAKILVKSPNPFFFAQFYASASPEKLGFHTDLTKPTAPLLTYE
jgi:hypothetical protein